MPWFPPPCHYLRLRDHPTGPCRDTWSQASQLRRSVGQEPLLRGCRREEAGLDTVIQKEERENDARTGRPQARGPHTSDGCWEGR